MTYYPNLVEAFVTEGLALSCRRKIVGRTAGLPPLPAASAPDGWFEPPSDRPAQKT